MIQNYTQKINIFFSYLSDPHIPVNFEEKKTKINIKQSKIIKIIKIKMLRK